MPRCGSQIILCDVPIRYDTYKGCGHACSYCFVGRKVDISKITTDESVKSLAEFIKGKRTLETSWCDWDIPLHWGGMSDPFQPLERIHKRSLDSLKVFAETQYPFIVSTKSALIGEEPYLSLIKKSNCVVQFSIASPQYDKIEQGAATFEQRMNTAAKIAPYKHVVFRIQPYITQIFTDVVKEIFTHVDVTRALRYAKVYISVFEEEKRKPMMDALKKAAGFIRHGVGQAVQLRYTPELLFELDTSIEYGVHISSLINKVMQGKDSTDAGDE